MSRIRWYHFYIVLTLVDVVVIMFSLQMHNLTISRVHELNLAEGQLANRLLWIHNVQKRVQELNAPGNDLFHVRSAEAYREQRRRFEQARKNMAAALASPPVDIGRLTLLKAALDAMTADATQLFEYFAPVAEGDVAEEHRERLLLRAGPTMAQMDHRQHEALMHIGALLEKHTKDRGLLIDQFDASLVDQMKWQSYVIAGIVLILAGILAFGRRMHVTQLALEKERLRVQEERRERLAAIGELCSSVAHGIRNPLAAIRSSAQLALELGKIDTDSAERLRDILDEGRRLGDRVTGLLGMARVNCDAFAALDVCEVVATAVKSLLPEVERRGLRLEHDGAGRAAIRGDRHQLEQAVIELVSNAIEHSTAGGSIRIACAVEDDGQVAVHVDDEGPGVPAEIRDRVFDLFFTTKPSGTGIGLASVKRVARLHGGDVTLGDAPGGGARFTIRIPLSHSARNGARRRLAAGLN